MAHYAKLSENNEVLQVLTLDDINEQNDAGETVESIGQAYLEKHNNWPSHLWKKTSYNTKSTPEGSVHALGGTPYRGVYASINMVYDSTKNVFRHKQPYSSWTFNDTSNEWEPPVKCPITTTDMEGFNEAGEPVTKTVTDLYNWDEENQTWVKTDPQYLSL
jgi:hypothetical protein